ncbi:uncharacterized protein YALI1_A21852g [Yarrowia lipolytica]|uniref:Secreted protein n=1 Tax=Yarrowia lipolytica TaxID=4952 RepID=A0A1D8N5P2_YARLL|nr:hypothetical protein YALI1_A21852g [Yarrowia lipolytica]
MMCCRMKNGHFIDHLLWLLISFRFWPPAHTPLSYLCATRRSKSSGYLKYGPVARLPAFSTLEKRRDCICEGLSFIVEKHCPKISKVS